jgi:hypothetical protein
MRLRCKLLYTVSTEYTWNDKKMQSRAKNKYEHNCMVNYSNAKKCSGKGIECAKNSYSE